MFLRNATLNDSNLLLEWRNEYDTRMNSHNKEEILPEQHKKWLTATLTNEDKHIFIAIVDNKPVGCIRADKKDGYYLLSWSVDTNHRKLGYCLQMVALIINIFHDSNLVAEIKTTNIASIKVAERCGMKVINEQDGVLTYQL